MGFTLGAHSFGLFWRHPAHEVVRRLAGQGFRRIEFIAFPPHFDLDGDDAAMAEALAETGVQVLALDLLANDVNLASPSPEVRAFAGHLYEKAVDRAAALGARWVVVVAGRRHGLLSPPDDRLLDGFRSEMDWLAQHARDRGIRLLLEVHPQSLLPTGADLARYVEACGHDNIDILYDVANGLAAGEQPCDGLRACGKHLAMVHLSDSPADRWAHDAIGTGVIDFDRFRLCLEEIEFSGPVVLEIIGPDPEALLADGRDRLERSGWKFN